MAQDAFGSSVEVRGGLQATPLLQLLLLQALLYFGAWLTYAAGGPFAAVVTALVLAGLLPIALLARAFAGRAAANPAQSHEAVRGSQPRSAHGNGVPEAVQAILDFCRSGGSYAANCSTTTSANAVNATIAAAGNGASNGSGLSGGKYCPPARVTAGPPTIKIYAQPAATAQHAMKAFGAPLHGGAASVGVPAAPAAAQRSKDTPPAASASARSQPVFPPGGGNSSSLKAPVGLSRCTIAEDAPYPPPNTQVVMELQERTLHVRGRRLRYRGYRPADRTLPLAPQFPPVSASVAGPDTARHAYLPPPHLQQQHPAAQPHLLPALAGYASHPALAPIAAAAAGMAAAPASSPHHHLSLSIKLPWAHPSSLPGGLGGGGGGLLESLNEALASGSGYMVVGAAVRPGCMLVQLELLAFEADREGGGGARRRRRGTAGAGTGAVEQRHRPLLSDADFEALGMLQGDVAHGGDEDVADGCTALVLAGAESEREWAGLQVEQGAQFAEEECMVSEVSPRSERRARRERRKSASAALAEQMARHIAQLVPQPPPSSQDGGAADGEIVVCLGGHLSYAVSYDASDDSWTAARDGHGVGALALLRRLGGRRGVRMRAGRAAVAVAAAAPSNRRPAPSPAPTTAPGETVVTLLVDVLDAEAAALLVERLQPLTAVDEVHAEAEAEAGQGVGDAEDHGQGQGKQHAAPEDWQLVANCLGRSLPVTVLHLQVLPQENRTFRIREGKGRRSFDAASLQERSPGSAASSTVSIQLAVNGTREALEAAACRLAVLSVELWFGGVYEVAQAPVMLVSESAAPLALPRSPSVASGAPNGHRSRRNSSTGGAGGSSGGGASGVIDEAAALVAELNGLVSAEHAAKEAAAGFVGGELRFGSAAMVDDDEVEGEQDVQQLLTDLGMLELYTASQRLAAAGDGVPLQADGDGDDIMMVMAASAAATAAAAPLLPGSVDMSAGLQRLMAAPDAEMRHTMVLTGANLLSYAVLRAMPYTAAAVRRALTALGCGLAEADRLSATAAGVTEDDAFGAVDPEAALHTFGAVALPDDEFGPDGGLPLMALAVLSGNLDIVRMLLRWAGEEGLGREWALRRHRGRSPLQVAAMAAWGGSAGCGGEDLGPWAAYLAAAERLLLQQEQQQPAEDARRSSEAPRAERRGNAEDDVCRDQRPPRPGQAAQPRRVAPTQSVATDAGARAHDAAPMGHALSPNGASMLAYEDDGTWGSGGHGEDVQNVAKDLHAEAFAAPTAERPGSNAAEASAQPLGPGSRLRRHPLLVCLRGYPDPAVEAAYRSFTRPMDAHVAGCWVALMCAALLAALARQLRGVDGDPAEFAASLLYAWPYVVLAASLALCRSATLRRLPSWWLLCGAARMSIKVLFAADLLTTPKSMLLYTRRGVTHVTDIVLPGLCERAPSPAALLLRAVEALAFAAFALTSGLAPNPAAAALQALLRPCIYLACTLAVEFYFRARFEKATRLVSGGGVAAGSVAGPSGAPPAWVTWATTGGEKGFRKGFAPAEAKPEVVRWN